MAEMQGAGDFVMVADPATFRVLPWAQRTPAGCCATCYFPNGKPVPFSTRQILRDALARLDDRRLRLSRRARSRIPSVQAGESAAHARGRHLAAAGAGGEPAQPGLPVSHREPLRSDRRGIWSRSAAASRRSACRCARWKSSSARASANSPSAPQTRPRRRRHHDPVPRAPPSRSRGATAIWRASCAGRRCRICSPAAGICTSRCSTANAAAMRSLGNAREGLSPLGRIFSPACLAHARAAAAFTTPTVNGYKRYPAPIRWRPIRAIWARDNRGVMVRVLGQPGDPSTHLENRIGEPAANPYLYMASQIYAGLDGIAHKLRSGPVGRYAVRDQGAAVAEGPRRSARRADGRASCFREELSATASSTITPTSRRPSSRASRPRPAAAAM